MKIHSYRPVLLPLVLIIFIIVLAELLPLFIKIDELFISVAQLVPDEWSTFFMTVTRLGDHWVLVGVALAVAAWELYRRRYVRSFVMAFSLIIMPIFYLIKETVERTRPVSEYVAQHGLHDYSFPSGHAAGSAAIYGMIAFLAYSHFKGIWKYSVTTLCIILIALIGFSRVYIGAHFPSDVLAGWLLALVVISLLRSVSLYIAKRSAKPDKEALQDSTEDPDTTV